MSYIVVDVESDGPVPGLYSMVCFGAVIVDSKLDKTFYGEIKPISDKWQPDALAISQITRKEHLTFPEPVDTMHKFAEWIKENSNGQSVFISDNNGYDFAFINYYFHAFYGKNPFGWSSRRIGDIHCGVSKDLKSSWKYLRKTRHTHNPVDDAMGNAEAFIQIVKDFKNKIF